MKKNVSLIVTALLLLSLLSTMLNIELSKAATITIYIRADGSIEPPSAPILNSGNNYTFTNDINGSIVIQRNNIVLDGAGHYLSGVGNGTGVNMSGRNNVTIKNLEIRGFADGIIIQSYPDAHNNTIFENKITNNTNGIRLWWNSYNNTISGNNIMNNLLGVNSTIQTRTAFLATA